MGASPIFIDTYREGRWEPHPKTRVQEKSNADPISVVPN